MLLRAVGRQAMQMAPQEIRTFFAGAVTWGRRAILRAEPMARLDARGRSCATGPKGPSDAGPAIVGLKPDASTGGEPKDL